jgi:hypothetical protein
LKRDLKLLEWMTAGFRSASRKSKEGDAMRALAGGVLLGLTGLVVLGMGFPEAQAQRPPGERAAASDLIALSYDGGDGRQQVTVVDPHNRVMAVYHIDRATGGLSLKSVRHLTWDLLIEDFNSANPTPREIRALTQQR